MAELPKTHTAEVWVHCVICGAPIRVSAEFDVITSPFKRGVDLKMRTTDMAPAKDHVRMAHGIVVPEDAREAAGFRRAEGPAATGRVEKDGTSKQG